MIGQNIFIIFTHGYKRNYNSVLYKKIEKNYEYYCIYCNENLKILQKSREILKIYFRF